MSKVYLCECCYITSLEEGYLSIKSQCRECDERIYLYICGACHNKYGNNNYDDYSRMPKLKLCDRCVVTELRDKKIREVLGG